MTRPAAESLQDSALILGFASLGAVSSVIPASIPRLAERLSVPAAELLPGVSLLFLGLLLGVLAAAGSRRGSARTLFPIGSAVQAVGVVLLAVAPSVLVFWTAAFVAGVGFGLGEASATALSRTRSANGTPARLTALNGAAAVAAAVAPLLLVFAPPSLFWQPIVVVALAPAGAAVLAVRARRSWPGAPSTVRSAVPSAVRSVDGSRGLVRRIWLMGAVLFVFVGAETVLAGWSSTLLQSLFDVPAGSAALGGTAFWTLMAVGRFLCTAALARGFPPRPYFSAAVLVGALLSLLAAFVGEGAGAAILICATVLLLAPGYALLLGAALADTEDARADRTASVLVAVGSAGGSAISFAVALTVGTAPAAVLLSVAALLAVCGVVSLVPAVGEGRRRRRLARAGSDRA